MREREGKWDDGGELTCLGCVCVCVCVCVWQLAKWENSKVTRVCACEGTVIRNWKQKSEVEVNYISKWTNGVFMLLTRGILYARGRGLSRTISTMLYVSWLQGCRIASVVWHNSNESRYRNGLQDKLHQHQRLLGPLLEGRRFLCNHTNHHAILKKSWFNPLRMGHTFSILNNR